MTRAAAVQLTTGKTAGQENFPVASRLLPAQTRATVMAFYRFARFADDVADDPDLSPEEKLAYLDALEDGLRGLRLSTDVAPAVALREATAGEPELIEQAALLLQAFRRDAVTDYCRDWADLMTYCRYSAAPVGRFLLHLHGEDGRTYPAADALCVALQILNHLQDCGADFHALNRVYVPRNWLLQQGLTNEVFEEDASPPELRAVLDRMLDGVDALLDLARPLPRMIRSRRLRLEAGVTLSVAEHLARLMRRRDPLAAPVALSRLGYAAAFLHGILRVAGSRA